MIKVGSDFSGVGAFNQALIRLGIEYKEIFACDMDKYARQTFIHNYGEPEYYPTNVYDRKIPKESLDIYMTSPPCQAFSLAGKRLGKDDKRGILFFNSHEFIKVNQPRFFIFENVKGLLSDDNGKTFQEWVNMLGGKSVNGVPVIFPYEDSVPYHLYWKVLNAKHHGVPQNRERVFLIGIRDDKDNNFSWPIEEHLTKRLKDVLENEVEEKYFLSEKAISHLSVHKEKHDEKGTGFGVELKDENSVASTLRANEALCPTDNHLKIDLKKYYLSNKRKKTIENSGRFIGWTDPEKKESSNCIISGYAKQPTDGEYIKIKSATSKGYEEATEGDSINFSVPNSETRRERVVKGVAQTLDTVCNHGILIDYKIRRLTPRECFRLMDFPDTFTWPVSDSQAYKQAGNSIVVNVLYKILKQLPL
jgi:DNA (cytosine-5)-methyltransferase 1